MSPREPRRRLFAAVRSLAGCVALLCAVAAPRYAHADEPKAAAKEAPSPTTPSAADVRKADALFQKARLLKQLGKNAEACPLFMESQRLDPSGGTLINIAECHEAEGKTGTAWRELTSALDLAMQTENKELVNGIRDKLKVVIPKLYRVKIQIPNEVSSIEGLDLRLDDTKLSAGVLSQVEVVDPGRHHLHGSAPGYLDFDRDVTLAGERRNVTILVSLVKPPPPPPPPDHTLAWGLVGGGIAAALLGGGLLATTRLTTGGDQAGLAVSGGVLLALGLGGGFTGAFLRATAASPPPPPPVVTRSKAQQTTLAVSPILAPGTALVSVSGTF